MKDLNTYSLDVLGCKVNQYDARQIARLLEGFGLREAGDVVADLVVVHTCGVTATAVQKSRQTLRRLIRKNPGATVFLTGCAAAGAGWIQMLADELQTFSLPNPDFHLPENADELAVDDFGGHTRAFLIGVPNIGRIRMSSLHPSELTDELLAVWAGSLHMMPHVHLSLQSGSDSVLERMGRGYTADEYAAAVERARVALGKRSPQANGYRDCSSRPVGDFFGPAITTDVIVGFPGETDAEFEETFEFCRRIGFAGMHIFTYSPRPGTRAADMPDPVDPQIAQVRHQRLAELTNEMTLEFNRTFVGKTVNVLVERCRDGICTGGSEHYIPVKFQGSEDFCGTVVPIKISEATAKELVGQGCLSC